MNTRRTAAIVLLLLLTLPFLARAERYRLVSHSIIPEDGTPRTQLAEDFMAIGTLDIEDGKVVVEMITHRDLVSYPHRAEGTFTVDPSGNLVTVHYTNGTSHTGVVIMAQPYLITLARDHGFAEVNVWRPQNAFERNK